MFKLVLFTTCFVLKIELGSYNVRVGSTIFGARDYAVKAAAISIDKPISHDSSSKSNANNLSHVSVKNTESFFVKKSFGEDTQAMNNFAAGDADESCDKADEVSTKMQNLSC